MPLPKTTRLRYVKAKSEEVIVAWLNGLGSRIQLYGNPTWTGKYWVLWFVPADDASDIESRDLRDI